MERNKNSYSILLLIVFAVNALRLTAISLSVQKHKLEDKFLALLLLPQLLTVKLDSVTRTLSQNH